MFYTNSLINHKLGTYTDDADIAKQFNLNISVPDIEIAYNGCAYEKGFSPSEPQKNYVELRLQEYPEISDQLDMIYWDKVNGTSIWQETIQKIKEKYPKN